MWLRPGHSTGCTGGGDESRHVLPPGWSARAVPRMPARLLEPRSFPTRSDGEEGRAGALGRRLATRQSLDIKCQAGGGATGLAPGTMTAPLEVQTCWVPSLVGRRVPTPPGQSAGTFALSVRVLGPWSQRGTVVTVWGGPFTRHWGKGGSNLRRLVAQSWCARSFLPVRRGPVRPRWKGRGRGTVCVYEPAGEGCSLLPHNGVSLGSIACRRKSPWLGTP